MENKAELPVLPQLNEEPTLEEFQLIHETIKPWIHKTPVLTSSSLDEEVGCSLFCKCQNFQKTGAFKARGAFARAFAITQDEKQKGILTSSSGNFASGLALACQIVKTPFATIVPNSLNKQRVDYLTSKGAQIIYGGTTAKDAIATRLKVLSESDKVFISSQTDYNVIAGQATASIELLQQQPELYIILTPVGGGGLNAGTCGYVSASKSKVLVYGAEPKERGVTLQSLAKGELVTMENPGKSIADGTNANISDVAFEMMRKTLSKVVLASDQAIRQAMRLIYQRLKIVVEPSGALPVAAILENKEEFKGKRVGVILTGGNLELKDFKF